VNIVLEDLEVDYIFELIIRSWGTAKPEKFLQYANRLIRTLAFQKALRKKRFKIKFDDFPEEFWLTLLAQVDIDDVLRKDFTQLEVGKTILYKFARAGSFKIEKADLLLILEVSEFEMMWKVFKTWIGRVRIEELTRKFLLSFLAALSGVKKSYWLTGKSKVLFKIDEAVLFSMFPFINRVSSDLVNKVVAQIYPVNLLIPKSEEVRDEGKTNSGSSTGNHSGNHSGNTSS